MMSLTAVQISELTAQFFLAAAGTLSFAILFACPRRCLPYCALVGAVGWLWYELLTLLGADAATASLLAVIPLTILTPLNNIIITFAVIPFHQVFQCNIVNNLINGIINLFPHDKGYA